MLDGFKKVSLGSPQSGGERMLKCSATVVFGQGTVIFDP